MNTGRRASSPRAVLAASVLSAGLGLSGCATNEAAVEANDPLEPVNRFVFAINDAVDTVAIRPLAVTYRDIVPEHAKLPIRSFLRNLRAPIIVMNEVLQGDFEDAGNAFTRFVVNSTLGLGGIADVAADLSPDLRYQSEDFGQTLAVWGLGDGPYIVLPLIGPSNARDTLGVVVDSVADPVGWVATANNLDGLNYARIGVTIVDARAFSLKAMDEIRASSVDYYAAVRSLYRQVRDAEIEDGVRSPDAPAFDTGGSLGPSEDPSFDELDDADSTGN